MPTIWIGAKSCFFSLEKITRKEKGIETFGLPYSCAQEGSQRCFLTVVFSPVESHKIIYEREEKESKILLDN